MKFLRITNSDMLAIIDSDMYDKLSKYVWSSNGRGYARTTVKGRTTFLHHLVLGKPPLGTLTDHINRNKLDNRRSNLRFTTPGANVQNQEHRSKYGYKGVARSGNRWQANIYKNRKRIFIGSFKTLEEAASAYNDVALEIYGKDAFLNLV